MFWAQDMAGTRVLGLAGACLVFPTSVWPPPPVPCLLSHSSLCVLQLAPGLVVCGLRSGPRGACTGVAACAVQCVFKCDGTGTFGSSGTLASSQPSVATCGPWLPRGSSDLYISAVEGSSGVRRCSTQSRWQPVTLFSACVLVGVLKQLTRGCETSASVPRCVEPREACRRSRPRGLGREGKRGVGDRLTRGLLGGWGDGRHGGC